MTGSNGNRSTSKLQAESLSLAYGKSVVVNDLCAEIPAGRITALVGPNGCGKSTLLRGMSRLLKARSGAAYIDGQAIHRYPTKELARALGVLPQGPASPEGLSVRDLVARGRFPHQRWYRSWSLTDESAVQSALEITGLLDLADRMVDSLSGGQRQRAWIAMTLAQETDSLLLDEPTTFLDLAHQIDVLDLLSRLNRERGKTVVMVLHDLNQACRYADFLIAMREGRIVREGRPAEVMTEEFVRDTFELECRIVPDPVTGTPMCVPIGRANAPVDMPRRSDRPG